MEELELLKQIANSCSVTSWGILSVILLMGLSEIHRVLREIRHQKAGKSVIVEIEQVVRPADLNEFNTQEPQD